MDRINKGCGAGSGFGMGAEVGRGSSTGEVSEQVRSSGFELVR